MKTPREIHASWKSLIIDVDKCASCKQCEKVCSLKHEGECNPALSRVKVLRDELMGSYFVSIPIMCQQCEVPICVEACPMEAIYKDKETGALLVDELRCTGCRMCVISCPLGAGEIHPDRRVSYRCDLCSGDPECVKVCLPGALKYIENAKAGYNARREALKKLANRLALISGQST